VSTYENVDNKD